MRGYSEDLRTRVVEAYETGEENQEEVAKRYRVGVRTLQAWVRLKRETGSVAPKPHGGGRAPAFDDAARVRLVAAVEAQPDRTLEELREASEATCSLTALGATLQRLGLTRKKRPCAPKNKSART